MPTSRRLASSTFAQTPYVHHGRRDVVPAPPTTGARLIAQTLMRAHGDGAASFNATATPSLVNDVTLGAYHQDDREVSRQSSSRPGTARSNKEQERSMCKYSFRSVCVCCICSHPSCCDILLAISAFYGQTYRSEMFVSSMF